MLNAFNSNHYKISLISATIFYLIVIAIFFTLIIKINYSNFTYTIDDPYIHLSLAENIKDCHYGINKDEYSSPSSSIIYSLLFVPFIEFDFAFLIPLIINIFCSIGIIYFYWKLLSLMFLNSSLPGNKKNIGIISFLIVIIFAGNFIYSTFRGMEHTLQALVSVIMIWGIINYLLYNEIPKIFYVAAIFAPLVRYENILITFALLLFLTYQKKKIALFISITILLLLFGFSLFLLKLGLEPLPLSVLRKSKLVNSHFSLFLFSQSNLILLIILCFFLNSFRIIKNSLNEKLLAGILSVVILVYIILGLTARYAESLITTAIFTLLFLYRDIIISALENKFFKRLIFFTSIIILLSYKQIASILIIPFAANNIYEQQYQLHRFATDYYKKPIAVNDIGCVSFRNNNYVLDLFGLSSIESFKYLGSESNNNWMDSLAARHHVNLVMIYENWFNKIPSNWKKIAELHLGNKQITVAGNAVSFFIREEKYYYEIRKLLNSFNNTLPGKTKLVIF